MAQANSWSLEELCLEVNVTTSQSATLDACSFGVTGEWRACRPSPSSFPLKFPAPVLASGWPTRGAWWSPRGATTPRCGEVGCPGARAVASVSPSVPWPVGSQSCSRSRPVDSPSRSEAAGGHVQQQQALALPRHLHRPPADAAALGQADQRREEGQRGKRRAPPSCRGDVPSPVSRGLLLQLGVGSFRESPTTSLRSKALCRRGPLQPSLGWVPVLP